MAVDSTSDRAHAITEAVLDYLRTEFPDCRLGPPHQPDGLDFLFPLHKDGRRVHELQIDVRTYEDEADYSVRDIADMLRNDNVADRLRRCAGGRLVWGMAVAFPYDVRVYAQDNRWAFRIFRLSDQRAGASSLIYDSASDHPSGYSSRREASLSGRAYVGRLPEE